MSYFDSPKNRAIWERELKALRVEKERRAREGYRPQPARPEKAVKPREENPFRRRVTLAELERAEHEEIRARRAKRPQRTQGTPKRQREPGMERTL